MRVAAGPTITDMRKPFRWSHLVSSAGQVSRATRSGAMISARRTVKRSRMRLSMAVSVMIVLPNPIPKRMAATGWDSMKSMVWAW